MTNTISRLETFFYTLIAHFILFGWYFAATNLSYFEGTFAREDGLVEWMTVFFLVLGCGLSIFRIMTLKKSKPLSFILFTSILAGLFLFGAGEEVSWGQRIFGWGSPEFFINHNSQQETNLHNLIIGSFKVNRYLFGTALGIAVALYFLVLPRLYDRFEAVRRWVQFFALPLPQWHHILSYILLFFIVSQNPSPKRGELLEFGGCAIFFLMTLFPKNKETFKA
jgi:hypothetical protein